MLHDIHDSPLSRLQGLLSAGHAAAPLAPPTAAAPTEAPAGARRAAPADAVTLSPAAQQAAAAANPSVGGPVRLDSLPADIFDFEAQMAKAESRLQALMGQFGIDRETDVTIRSDRAGRFSVESDHPRAAELEEAINRDPEMRNALIAAENAAIISRLAAASVQAMQAADANPAMTERYYDWLRNVAAQTQATPFHFEMSGGALSGGFTGAQGQMMALTEGLRLPA